MVKTHSFSPRPCSLHQGYTFFITHIMEMLYAHVGKWNKTTGRVDREEPQSELLLQINKILKLYKTGFFLEPVNGFIMAIPNDALHAQLQSPVPTGTPQNVIDKLASATRMYYRLPHGSVFD